jgi:hypothetical protein
MSYTPYEQGTWTPELWDTSNSGSESQTYVTQEGDYIKHGQVVILSGQVAMSSLGTLTAGSQARIGNLPFTTLTSTLWTGHIFLSGAFNLVQNSTVMLRTSGSLDYIQIVKYDITSNPIANHSSVLISEVSADGAFDFSFTYLTAG